MKEARAKFLNLDLQKEKLLKVFNEFDSSDKDKMIKAFNLAEKAHAGQEREGGVPYIIHPIRAALILIEKAKIKNTDLVCAILLHDVLEDTDMKEGEIRRGFGKEVLRLVKIVTRKRSTKETIEERIKSKEKKIQEIARSDKSARLVKLCDRLDNRYSQEFLPKDHCSRQKNNRWDKDFKLYLPIAKKTNDNLFRIFKKFNEN